MTAGVEEKWYAARAWFDGFNNLRGQEISVDKDKQEIKAAENDFALKMTFTKVKEGEYKDMYTIQDANGKYLYASSSSGNQLKAKDEPDVNAYWTVTIKDDDYSIIASKSDNRNVMRFNPNGNNDAIVACYASDSQSPVKLYPASMISGGSPVVTSTTVADILEGGAGSYGKVENLLVYAVSGKNAIVGDSTGKMLLFMDNTLKVGDNITITNAVTTVYSQVVLEITGGTIATNSSDNTVNHGSSIAIDDYTTYNAQLAAFSAEGFHPAVYVAMIGDQSGRNIQGSNAKLYLSQANDATNNKRVETLGYVYAYSSSHSNFYYQAVSITEYTEPGAPSLSVSPNELSWATNEYGQSNAKEVTVTLNAEVDEDNYTISGSDDNWVVTPYGGNGGTISVYPKTANTGSSARTFSFDVVHSDDNSVKQTVTCTQAANAVTISTILADATVTSSNTVNYEVDGVTVMAAQGGKNYVIGDATGVMLMYVNQTLTVGKQYKVSGGVKLYNGVHEFTGTLNITESTGTAPAAGTPETMTVSSLTAYAAAPVTKYAVVTATAQSSGYLCSDGTNTINVYDGTGTWSQFYGKQVKVTGYLIGFYNKINMIATAIEDNTDPNTPSISADVTSLTWASNEYGTSAAKSIKVTINANASGYTFSWGVGRNNVFDVVDNGDNTVSVYPIAANTSTTEDLKSALRIEHKDDRSLYAEISLTQSKVSSGPAWTRITSVDELLAGGTCILGYEATANSGVIVPMANKGSATTSAAGFMYSGSTATSGGSGTINMATVTETSDFEVTIVASTTVSGAICIKIGNNFIGNTNTKNNCKLFTAEAKTAVTATAEAVSRECSFFINQFLLHKYVF